jgi:hypothetical protein
MLRYTYIGCLLNLQPVFSVETKHFKKKAKQTGKIKKLFVFKKYRSHHKTQPLPPILRQLNPLNISASMSVMTPFVHDQEFLMTNWHMTIVYSYLPQLTEPKYFTNITRWRRWLRHCATSRKVASSIPNGVTGIFYWHNPSGRTIALVVDSASNRNQYQEYLLVGKGGRCVGLTTLPPSCADCLQIWEPQPTGTLRVCRGL